MEKTFDFPCGCSFDIIGYKDNRPLIDFSPNINTLNLECEATWDLLSEGNTKGCFQLESRLGQSMSKKLRPRNIEQLAGLISILRPGCLEAYRDGKSVSNHYIDKKNGLESIDHYHESLEPVLDSTYGEMIYQEQAMAITQTIAGFDLQEADMLRKAIGKKKPEEMAKVKTKFLKGCKKLDIVDKDQAIEIFTWIEKSQRYSFNKSHAVSYAMNAYLSAYAKAHFPKIFFASYLRFAKDKIDPQQEIKELIRNANEMDVTVCTPDIRHLNEFFVMKDSKIFFGLTDIKGLGNSVFKKIVSILKDQDTSKWTWLNFLSVVLVNINSTAAKALIGSGAMDFCKKTRTEMLFEFELFNKLTKKERSYIEDMLKPKVKTKDVFALLSEHSKVNVKRKAIVKDLINNLENPPYSLNDKIEWLSDTENQLLGSSITCCKIDSYDISMTNTDCKAFKQAKSVDKNKQYIMAAEISYINYTKTKTGKNPGQEMAFVSVEDQFGALDSVIFFPEALSAYRAHLYNNNVLIFVGKKSKNKDGFIVDKCYIPST